MIHTLKLLLPALIPSWKFFKTVEPSPRVQWRLLNEKQSNLSDWQEYRPRPHRLSPATILRRLFWNPLWNENLYMVSLAERLSLNPTDHSRDEIFALLNRQACHEIDATSAARFLQFQLVFISRQNSTLHHEVTCQSAVRKLEIPPQ